MDCQSTFFCSPRHWALVKKTHNTVPASVDYEKMTRCQINKRIREDIRLSNHLLDAKIERGEPEGPLLQWAPSRTMESWQSVKSSNWESEFLEVMKTEFPLPGQMSIAPFLRAASEGLTLPMTILHALDEIHQDDLAFTHKEVLVIHVSALASSIGSLLIAQVLGASSIELHNSMAFEEIMHRLPEVKRVEVVQLDPSYIAFLSLLRSCYAALK